MDNVDDIMRKLYENVLDFDGKRIPETRIIVFGTRIFVPKYLTSDDVIVCTDLVDYIYLKRIGTYHNLHYVAHNKVSEWVNKNQFLENMYNCIGNKNGIGMKRFDYAFTNPPYDGDLHLKILNELRKFSRKTVCVQPANWFIDPLIDFKDRTKYGKYKKELEPYIEKVQMILTHEEAIKVFKIESNELMVAVYSNENTGFKQATDDMVNRIVNSPKKYIDYIKHSETDYFIPVAKFHWTAGDTISFAPFSLLLSDDGIYAKTGWKKGLHDTYELFYFDTQEELDNCRDMLNSDWYKEMLGKYFIGKRLSAKLIPMPINFKTKVKFEDVFPVSIEHDIGIS